MFNEQCRVLEDHKDLRNLFHLVHYQYIILQNANPIPSHFYNSRAHGELKLKALLHLASFLY